MNSPNCPEQARPSLSELTRELHHACEAHPIGQAMVSGSIQPGQWADWLWAMRAIHMVVDSQLPGHMDRVAPLSADLALLPRANPSRAALRFAADLAGPFSGVVGAAYVLHGAHRSGGRVLAPKMAKLGLPTNHTSYIEPHAVRRWLDQARARADMADQARATFECLLAVLGEIEARNYGRSK